MNCGAKASTFFGRALSAAVGGPTSQLKTAVEGRGDGESSLRPLVLSSWGGGLDVAKYFLLPPRGGASQAP